MTAKAVRKALIEQKNYSDNELPHETTIGSMTECGGKYRDESKKWYIKYKDQDGKWQRVPGYSDKGATAQLAAELERQREQVQSGLADPHEAGKLRPLSKHLDDFQQFLASKSNSAKHVKQTCHRIRRLLDGCEFKSWKDIRPSRVVNWLALEREAGRMGSRRVTIIRQHLRSSALGS